MLSYIDDTRYGALPNNISESRLQISEIVSKYEEIIGAVESSKNNREALNVLEAANAQRGAFQARLLPDNFRIRIDSKFQNFSRARGIARNKLQTEHDNYVDKLINNALDKLRNELDINRSSLNNANIHVSTKIRIALEYTIPIGMFSLNVIGWLGGTRWIGLWFASSAN